MTTKRSPLETCCLVTLLVTLVVAALLVVGFLCLRYRIASGTKAREKAYAETDAKYPFNPSGAVLTKDRLEVYVTIRQSVLPHLRELENQRHSLRAEKAEEGGGTGLAVKAAREMIPLTLRMQDAHAAALNQHRMSVSEYRWIARRAFATLSVSAQRGYRDCPNVWASVAYDFTAGAPRIRQYQEDPPEVRDKLDIEGMEPTAEEMELVYEYRQLLFEPRDVLYNEVAFVLTEGEDE